MTGSLEAVQSLGQSIWYDNVSRDLLISGEIENLIQLGVTGLTSNPTIFEKAIAGSTHYDDNLLSLADHDYDTKSTYEMLAIEDIRSVADLLRPVYERTSGRDGYACLEVSPSLAHDTEGTIAEAVRLFSALDRPNTMIKVPATPQGIPAIRYLIGQGMNINVTLIFSLETHSQVMEAYIAGLEDMAQAGGDVSKVASVASFFVSRLDTAVDTILGEYAQQGQKDMNTLAGKAAIANAKLAYKTFKSTFRGKRWNALQAKGCLVQRPLWASTGTKNPSYSDVLYVDNLIGKDTVNTMPTATLNAFMEHGQSSLTIENDMENAAEVMKALETAGINIKEITDKLLTDGVKAFSDSFDQLLINVEQKKATLITQRIEHQVSTSGTIHQ